MRGYLRRPPFALPVRIPAPTAIEESDRNETSRLQDLPVDALAAPLNSVVGPMANARLVDPRLLGTWRSDAPLTLANWTFASDTSDSDRARIEEYFGKTTLRYTAAKITSEFDGARTVCPYRVATIDKDWVAIIRREAGRDEIQHLRFVEPDVYCVSVGRNKEYFRRVGP